MRSRRAIPLALILNAATLAGCGGESAPPARDAAPDAAREDASTTSGCDESTCGFGNSDRCCVCDGVVCGRDEMCCFLDCVDYAMACEPATSGICPACPGG